MAMLAFGALMLIGVWRGITVSERTLDGIDDAIRSRAKSPARVRTL